MCIEGELGESKDTFLIGIGKATQAKHRFRVEKCLAVVEWSGKKKTGLMKKRHLTEMKMNNSSLR